MKFTKHIFLLLIIFQSCINHKETKHEFKNGDLVFVGVSRSNLSNAINDVTQTDKQDNFSHIAMIEIQNDSIWILHSSTENGSERILWDEFKNRATKDSSKIVLYRIKENVDVDFENAIKEAKSMLNKPYNFTYILSDSAYYCSDFVHNAFAKNNIFEMEPMTFKIDNSEEFHPTWIEFYKKLNVEIPEGKLGCNPNGMANSPKITRIKEIN